MAKWIQSDIYPQWHRGNGIWRTQVVGPGANGKYVRKYNKIASILGIDFVAKKDQYESGNFGFAALAEGSNEGTWSWSRTGGANAEKYMAAFDYAYAEMYSEPVEEIETEEEIVFVDSGRGTRVETSVPVLLIVAGVIALITIIYFLK